MWFWKAIVWKKASSNRSGHRALYALWAQSRCAPAVIPSPATVPRSKPTDRQQYATPDPTILHLIQQYYSWFSNRIKDITYYCLFSVLDRSQKELFSFDLIFACD